MGDTRGRGLCLLLSVILMGVPTVSGCELPWQLAGDHVLHGDEEGAAGVRQWTGG
jgi:hypothetical protein